MEQRHHQIEYLPLDSIVPYINNPRDNADAVDPVASSIAEFDFNSPIAVDAKHVIINGHTRYLAAKKLGLKEIPCIICDHLTEAQCKAYRLADNRVAEYSHWDADKLMAELDRLGELDYNDVPGFDSSFLDSLVAPDPTGKLAGISDDVESDEQNSDDDTDHCGRTCPRCGYPIEE